MIKQITPPAYSLSCDWCGCMPPGAPAAFPDVPPDWRITDARFVSGPSGWHLHFCPDCAAKVLALRKPAPWPWEEPDEVLT